MRLLILAALYWLSWMSWTCWTLASQPPTTATVTRYALARVLAESGKPLLNAPASDDLVVEEDGERRTVISVAPAAYPVAVLLDTSGFARDDFFRLREAATHFVRSLRDREVAVYTFGDRSARLTPFTRDTKALARAVETTFAADGGEVHVIDAFIEAAEEIGRLTPMVSTIVVVSGGGRDRSRRNLQDLREPLSRSHAIVRVVDRRRPQASTARSGGRDQAVQTALGDEDILREFVERTQGQFIQIAGASGYQAALDQALEQMASEWIVAYEGLAQPHSRSVRLGIRLPGATIRGIGLGVLEK